MWREPASQLANYRVGASANWASLHRVAQREDGTTLITKCCPGSLNLTVALVTGKVLLDTSFLPHVPSTLPSGVEQ